LHIGAHQLRQGQSKACKRQAVDVHTLKTSWRVHCSFHGTYVHLFDFKFLDIDLLTNRSRSQKANHLHAHQKGTPCCRSPPPWFTMTLICQYIQWMLIVRMLCSSWLYGSGGAWNVFNGSTY
jgi:hypothetical protein